MGIDPIWIFPSVCEVPDVNHRATTSRNARRFMLRRSFKKIIKIQKLHSRWGLKCGIGVELLASALKYRLS